MKWVLETINPYGRSTIAVAEETTTKFMPFAMDIRGALDGYQRSPRENDITLYKTVSPLKEVNHCRILGS
jgi:hypothetical protein